MDLYVPPLAAILITIMSNLVSAIILPHYTQAWVILKQDNSYWDVLESNKQ